MCIAIRHISWHWWRVVLFCVATLLSATSHAQQPQIRNLDPGTLMARDGSQQLTLQGSNFRPGLTVTVIAENGRFRKILAPSQVAVDSTGQITLRINTTADPDDSWQVFVTNPDGTRSNVVGFSVVSAQPHQSQRQAPIEQQQRQSLLDGVTQLERGLQTLPPGESRERAQRELTAARNAIQAGRMDEARQRLSAVQQAMQTTSVQQQQLEAERQRQAEQQRQSQLEQQRQSEAERQRQRQMQMQMQMQAEQQRQAEIDRQRQIGAERQQQAQTGHSYGDVIGEFKGIKAHSNADCTGTFKGKCDKWQENAEYQCVDYAKRYYAKNTVVNSTWGSASTFWNRRTHEGFQRYLNDGSSNQLPQRGDMLFFYTGQEDGHVAIVMDVNPGRVRVIQQNIKRNTAYANIDYQKDGNKMTLN